MPVDSSEYVRLAIVGTLQDAPTVTVLVPAERVYPGQRPPNPVWPFLAYGRGTAGEFRTSGADGSTVSVAIHAYAETGGTGDDTVAGEDMADALVRIVAAVLGDQAFDLVALADCPYPAIAHVSWTGSQVVQDGSDAAAFHGIATFDIVVVS